MPSNITYVGSDVIKVNGNVRVCKKKKEDTNGLSQKY